MADPGFPMGGINHIVRGVDSRGSYVLKILYDEMKESGLLGGGDVSGTPPRPANGQL